MDYRIAGTEKRSCQDPSDRSLRRTDRRCQPQEKKSGTQVKGEDHIGIYNHFWFLPPFKVSSVYPNPISMSV